MTAKPAARTPGPWHVNAILGNRIVGDETAPAFDKLQINNHNCTIATVYRAADARFIVDAANSSTTLRTPLKGDPSKPQSPLVNKPKSMA